MGFNMEIHIIIPEATLQMLVIEHLRSKLGDVPLVLKDVKIEVKSKQNFKSEWENAAFRATYSVVVP